MRACVVSLCRQPQSHVQTFNRAGVLLEVRVCENHARQPVPFPNGDLERPIHSERLDWKEHLRDLDRDLVSAEGYQP